MSYLSAKRSESSASRISGDGYTTEDGGDDRDDCKRRSRNLSEKKRRDQFNILINELCSMVSSSRKMDKSTVLKATISFLKANNAQAQGPDVQGDWKPAFLSNEEFTYLMLEAMDGFIVVISESGKINYVSESVTTLLGYMPSDLMSTSLYDIIPAEERSALFNVLAGSVEDKSKKNFSVTLNIRLGGLEIDLETNKHQLVKFNGYYKRLISTDRDPDCGETDEENSGERDAERQTPLPSKYVVVCTGRLVDSDLLRDMSTVVASSDTEFSSRHSLEWKFLFLDHRAPPLIGYLPFEVLGTSGYDYYHVQDLEKVASCHEELMRKGEGTSCYYRFLTKGQQWIWLQTRYYITHHQWNSKPEFIACTHRVVSYEDVIKDLRGESSESSSSFGSYLPKSIKMESKVKSCASSTSGSNRVKSSGHSDIAFSGRKRSSSSRRDRDILPKPSTDVDLSGRKFKPEPVSTETSNETQAMSMNHMPLCSEQVTSTIGSSMADYCPSRSSLLLQETSSNSSVSQLLQVQPVPVLSLPLSAFQIHPIQSTSASQGYPSSSGILLTPTLQQQLLLKQAELQRHILQQQEELRRVSEQLMLDHAESGSIMIPPGSHQSQYLALQFQQHHDANSVQEQLQQHQGYSDGIQYPHLKP